MPITANAKKALRQQNARAVRNQVVRSQVRTIIKKVQKQPTEALMATLYSVVDKAVKRNVVHKNTAARIKAQAVADTKKTGSVVTVKPSVSKKKTSPKAKKTTATKTKK